jgi:hypothetical protein
MSVDIPEGWTSRLGVVAGTRVYSSDRYPGWSVYDVGQGGVVTVYHDGDTHDVVSTVEQAIGLVEIAAQANG